MVLLVLLLVVFSRLERINYLLCEKKKDKRKRREERKKKDLKKKKKKKRNKTNHLAPLFQTNKQKIKPLPKKNRPLKIITKFKKIEYQRLFQ